jgi:hypothetical protein
VQLSHRCHNAKGHALGEWSPVLRSAVFEQIVALYYPRRTSWHVYACSYWHLGIYMPAHIDITSFARFTMVTGVHVVILSAVTRVFPSGCHCQRNEYVDFPNDQIVQGSYSLNRWVCAVCQNIFAIILDFPLNIFFVFHVLPVLAYRVCQWTVHWR